MLQILIYCLPAFGWGLMPIIARKVGGNPVEQLIGTTIAALCFGLLINLVYHVSYTKTGVIVSLISGIFWSFGQLLQFMALKESDVSKVMPVSNGTQLLFTSLSSGLILKEWQSALETGVALLVIILVIIAMVLFTKEVPRRQTSANLSLSSIIKLIGSSLCLTGYVTITNAFHVTGLMLFLPQAVGMILSATIIALVSKEEVNFWNITKNTTTGLSWAIANSSLFYAAAHLGLGLSYTISQLCIFVSIFGGVFILEEKKTKREAINLFLGITLFFVSIYLLSIFK